MAKKPESTKQHPMVKMLDAGYVQKDKKNKGVGYTYASDEAVSRKVREAMSEVGIYVRSFVIDDVKHMAVETIDHRGNRKVSNRCIVSCTFIFSDSATGDEYGPYQGIGEGIDGGDKASMKALTAARKYALQQSVLLSSGDDPEGDSKTDENTAGGVAAEEKPNGKPQQPEKPTAHEKATDDLFDGAAWVLRVARPKRDTDTPADLCEDLERLKREFGKLSGPQKESVAEGKDARKNEIVKLMNETFAVADADGKEMLEKALSSVGEHHVASS